MRPPFKSQRNKLEPSPQNLTIGGDSTMFGGKKYMTNGQRRRAEGYLLSIYENT
jgi:hypothetical protein